jgi:hypothetical protein
MHVHIVVPRVQIETLVVVFRLQGLTVEVPLLIAATVAIVHVYILVVVVVISTLVAIQGLQLHVV